MLEVYTGQTEKKKRPLLRLSKDGEGQLDIILVDDAGAPLADFGQIAGGVGVAFEHCDGALESFGYDTTWAEWDDTGRFVRFAEESSRPAIKQASPDPVFLRPGVGFLCP